MVEVLDKESDNKELENIKSLYERLNNNSITLDSRISIMQYLQKKLKLEFKNTEDLKSKMSKYFETHTKGSGNG